MELYTHHESVKNIVAALEKWNYRVQKIAVNSRSVLIHVQITAVHLVDSFHCTNPPNYISILLLSLSTMLQLELPHINVLSKIDMIEKYGQLGTCLRRVPIVRVTFSNL